MEHFFKCYGLEGNQINWPKMLKDDFINDPYKLLYIDNTVVVKWVPTSPHKEVQNNGCKFVAYECHVKCSHNLDQLFVVNHRCAIPSTKDI